MDQKTREKLSREKVLDVAERHFARYGYRKTSLHDIASEIGVVKGALYYYIPGGKRELLEAVMARADAHMIEAMTLAANAETAANEALVGAIRAKLQFLGEALDLHNINREVGEELQTLLVQRDREFGRHERELFEAILTRGEESGVFRSIRPRAAAAAAIQAMVRALQMGEIYEGKSGAGTPSLLDAMFDLVLRGLLLRG